MKSVSVLILLLVTCHRLTPDELKINNNTDRGICFATAAYDFKDPLFRISSNGYLQPGETKSPMISIPIKEKLEKLIPDSTIYILFFDGSIENYLNNNLSKAFRDTTIFKMEISKKKLDSLNWYITFNGR